MKIVLELQHNDCCGRRVGQVEWEQRRSPSTGGIREREVDFNLKLKEVGLDQEKKHRGGIRVSIFIGMGVEVHCVLEK